MTWPSHPHTCPDYHLPYVMLFTSSLLTGSSGYDNKETEDQTDTGTADRPAVYPYAMDRLDDAISFIPFDEFQDLWKLVREADQRDSSGRSIDQQQEQLIVNTKTGRRRQEQPFLPPNPSLAQVLAISMESVSPLFRMNQLSILTCCACHRIH